MEHTTLTCNVSETRTFFYFFFQKNVATVTVSVYESDEAKFCLSFVLIFLYATFNHT